MQLKHNIIKNRLKIEPVHFYDVYITKLLFTEEFHGLCKTESNVYSYKQTGRKYFFV